MTGIQLTGIDKRYGGVDVIKDLTLTVDPGEFLVFLGPSGCGKSTLLRMIAGLEPVSGGEIRIGGRTVTDLPPGERQVAMVFQHYALYPHMTAYDNMAFGLRNVGMPANEIHRRVQEAARMLELEPLLRRKSAQMSGGQRQRVAIGRAVVKEPAAFLFDEPLSNLDAALRARTRVEIARLHRRLKSTMVFVTHDQVEAMTLATRIVVMKQGSIEQIGRPMEIYRKPASRFVASFIGSPAMNFLEVTRGQGAAGRAAVRLPDGTLVQTTVPEAGLPDSAQLELGVRPEFLSLADPQSAGVLVGTAEVIERLGDQTHAHIALKSGDTVVAHAPRDSDIAAGDVVGLRLDASAAHLFDHSGKAHHAAKTPWMDASFPPHGDKGKEGFPEPTA
ncbi:sn-glycerol-3-phosphate ABC transporter ATP-binding protein UgpC [Verminephrobacter aporrectodeae subsp. tuberculatae]|uniref:ABC transporter ATP-binding protein n=1 Tax=Verminephrobacter aporrectodeae TaxID=1110389 RepID=UPI002238EE7E|nr:sn-glycerol-3-phosphate ABC transporter ATP-binding protein UgpC [Verminephrobacter aporrectodeae]MCW5258637.1 sn-glycerol-3-phosphate ABC transporter ATP-binding protein UgpC [Verminephrobacter aporrectodeae subsp. tuberculatae]